MRCPHILGAHSLFSLGYPLVRLRSRLAFFAVKKAIRFTKKGRSKLPLCIVYARLLVHDVHCHCKVKYVSVAADCAYPTISFKLMITKRTPVLA